MPPQPKKARIEAPAASETTIDKLNDDVLVEIFSYLDSSNLKTAALVCKQWNGVIGMSAVTMKKFRLELNRRFFVKNGSGLRKHQRVELDVEVLGRALNNLHRFNVSQAKFAIISGEAKVDCQQLAQFLSLMPLLERLELQLWPINYINDSPAQRVNLPKLRDFSNSSDDCRLYDFISADNLTDLTCFHIIIPKKGVIVSHADKLISFLSKCKKLTSLGVSAHIFIELFHLNEMPAIEFKLESFTLPNTYETSYDQNISFDRFEQFLISQAPTLTTLQIPQKYLKFPSDVFKTIFRRLTLKVFSVHGDALPVDQKFYDDMRPLESLRELTIDGKVPLAVIKFLPKCPNIQSLDLQAFYFDIVEHVARNNPKVTWLSIYELRKAHPNGLQFRSLKEFNVRQIKQGSQIRGQIDDFSHWLSVIRNSPEIETLHVTRKVITANTVGELMKQPKLKQLEYFGEGNALERNLSKIREKYKTVEVLTFDQIDGSKRVVLNFPSQLN